MFNSSWSFMIFIVQFFAILSKFSFLLYFCFNKIWRFWSFFDYSTIGVDIVAVLIITSFKTTIAFSIWSPSLREILHAKWYCISKWWPISLLVVQRLVWNNTFFFSNSIYYLQSVQKRTIRKMLRYIKIYIHTYIFGTNSRKRARPRTFSKLWSA